MDALMKATRSRRLQDFFMELLDASAVTNGPLPTAERERSDCCTPPTAKAEEGKVG